MNDEPSNLGSGLPPQRPQQDRAKKEKKERTPKQKLQQAHLHSSILDLPKLINGLSLDLSCHLKSTYME